MGEKTFIEESFIILLQNIQKYNRIVSSQQSAVSSQQSAVVFSLFATHKI
jgi:hypothetical protein